MEGGLVLVGQMVSAGGVGAAQGRPVEGLFEESTEHIGLAEADESTESSLAVRSGRVEKDPRHGGAECAWFAAVDSLAD